ncbi:MAG: nicotinamide-nucleotide amidohydrolase family protein [Thermoleophilia bacterium]|nr:nicotinamide-nucleotide amidohydrolase family protein [Thermoleophilia bacterium]
MHPARAALVITGDELLRGFIQDAHSGFLAEQLRDQRIDLVDVHIVGDDFARIEAALRRDSGQEPVDLVIVSGGLGPTHDDRTTEAVGRATGRGLEVRADALKVVAARVRAYGRRTDAELELFAAGNRKQATMPTGALWLDPLGTAPGYVLDGGADGVTYVVLPGPPSELRHAWSAARATAPIIELGARGGTRHERLLRVWGIAESAASRLLDATGHVDGDGCRVTICARDGELELSVRGTDAAAVDALVAQLEVGMPDEVFARDDERPIAQLVGAELTARAWTLATAESCTGGLLGGDLTAGEGASTWYHGGFVTYSYEAKTELLGVETDLLERVGAVSEEVARAMARGARARLGSDVAVAITGVAGPGGGTPEKPVGTVHLAVVSPAGELHRQIRMPGDRATVRRRSCVVALHMVRELLAEG